MKEDKAKEHKKRKQAATGTAMPADAAPQEVARPATGPPADAAFNLYKKKKKGNKNKHSNSATENGIALHGEQADNITQPFTNDASSDHQEKAKKKRKREHEAAEKVSVGTLAAQPHAASPPALQQGAADAMLSLKTAKKEKRKHKKAHKQSAHHGAMQASNNRADSPAVGHAPRKADKHPDTATADGAGPCAAGQCKQRLAAVGNAQLAQELPPIQRALYTEHAEIAAMSAKEVATVQSERGISVDGSDVRPVTAFHQLGLDCELLHAVQGFSMPSPIQAQCWPIVLSGHDLIGIAATGSGAPACSLRARYVL